MSNFAFSPADIGGLTLVTPFKVEDERGFFLKTYEKQIFNDNGIAEEISEDFETFSIRGVLRGLHFQTQKPQAKLVRAVSGYIFDVAVDLRADSPTYGRWQGFYLDDKDSRALFIPAGFAHGFLVLSENARVNYKCAGAFLAEFDSGIRYDDADIGIRWPLHRLEAPLILSQKDKSLMSFKEFDDLIGRGKRGS